MRVFKSTAFLLAFTSIVFSQQPAAIKVDAAKSALGAGQSIPPGLIDAAKTQIPGLQGLSPDQINAQVEALRNDNGSAPVDATAAAPGSSEAKPGAGGEENGDLPVSGQRRGLGSPGRGPGAGRFPSGLARFGSDFFENADVGGLGPNAPSLPDYQLSAGDEILISTWGRENRTQAVIVDNEGMLHFPPLDPLRVAGLKFDAAQSRIVSEIQKIQGITASVSLGRLRSIRIMVLGEAVRPGSYAVPAGATLTSALFRSGGVTPIGSLRSIELRRAGKVIATLDLYDMLLKGSSRSDIQLVSGDAIFIPLAGPQVAVYGMVKRPAIYEVRGGLKALDAVQLAGGLQSSAFKGRIRLDRVQNNKRNVVLDVNMEQVTGASNVLLQDGDILYVDRVLDRLDEAVTLMGNVNRPGSYQYKRGMTVRDLIPTLQDLKPETFFELAHIRRPAPDDDRPMLLNFSLADVFSKGAKVALQPRDVVVIYSRYDVVERPLVTIGGAVRRSGDYSFGEGMTISDLIIMGGGLGDAYLPEAHLFRMLPNSGTDSLYRTLMHIDLREALLNPTGEANIELQAFDSLYVYPRGNFVLGKSVSIYGAVAREGSFELASGMGIPELVKAAGGLSRNSFTLGIEVARRTLERDSVMTRTVLKLSLKDLLDGRSTFALQDGDAVYVREVVNSREHASIVLSGEFAFPGRYEFSPGEKLSSVVRRAGGFSKEAYLRGAVFLRESVRAQQLRHADEVGRRLDGQLQARMLQTTQESERQGILLAMERRRMLLGEIERAPYLGRVVIKIDRKMKFEGTDWDMELENGDQLTIGPRVSTVSVLGEVSSPTTLILTRKTNQIGEVLDKAGGVNTYGDYNETFYIAPDGAISTPRTTPWYASYRCKNVESGGTVIVPLKPPKKDYLEIWVQATQILYQLAITVGVVNQLF